MGWFRKSKQPAKKAVSGDPVVQSLVLVLNELRQDAPSKNAAAFSKVIARLDRPPAPSGLVREVARLLELRGKSASNSPGSGGSAGAEYTEMAESLVRTMRRLALLDQSLDRRIAALMESVPKKIGRVDAHRLVKRAKELDGFAKPVRQRAMEDRKEMAQMLKEISTGLAKAGSAGTLLHERVGRVVDVLAEQPNAKSAADARRTLLAQVREVAAGLDQLRGDLHKANERSKGLEDLVATQTAELLDMQSTAALDPLTELCHRVTFDNALTFAVRRALAVDHPLSLVLIDVDHYQNVSDAHGSTAAEDLLVAIASYLRQHLRDEDVLARVETSQFAVILSGLDDAISVTIANRIRIGVSKIKLTDDKDKPYKTTISAGVAMLEPSDKSKHLMSRAGDALDEARDAGRDRIVLAT